MFQRFNDDNMLTKFIKNLLFTTYIPTVQIWKIGKPIIKDFIYVTKNYIVKAIANWPSNNSSRTNYDGPQSEIDDRYFKIISHYIRGNFYRGVTSNYESNTSNYDSEIHYYLGQYLRMIRDLDDIDLMQYYNCWNGSYSDKIRFNLNTSENNQQLEQTIEIIQNNKKNDGLKTLLVPIKFNTKYTIYINSNIPFTICPVYYDGINIIRNRNISNPLFYKKISRCAFNSPYLYEGIDTTKNNLNTNTDNNTILFEEYLNLLIQIPENNMSSVVILEGDYTNIDLINIIKGHYENNIFKYDEISLNKLTEIRIGDDINRLSEIEYENLFKSIPSLTRQIDGQNYAFSDRLIEYLLLNVITKNDEISQNIERIQTYNSSIKSNLLNGKMFYSQPNMKGIWDKYLRKYNYDLATNFKEPLSFDINGYVDKDTEELILRGK